MNRGGRSLGVLLGRRIRQLRQKMNLSQHKLALKAGLDPSFLSLIERGQKAATVNTIEKIAGALDITYIELFNFAQIRGDNQDYETLKEKFYAAVNDNSVHGMLLAALDTIEAYQQRKKTR